MFEQILNPTGHLWLTVVMSLIPLVALILMLAVFRITAWIATIIAGVITIPLGVLVWHASLASIMKSYLYGGLTGIWSIDWITFWGLIIFNTDRKSTRLNSSHLVISYAVFCLKEKQHGSQRAEHDLADDLFVVESAGSSLF